MFIALYSSIYFRLILSVQF